MDAPVAFRGEVGEKRHGGDPACTDAEDVDALAAGDLAHRIDGLEEGGEVRLESPLTLRGGGVAPADHEGLHATVDRVLDKASTGGQVEHVELVDLGWHDEEWPTVGLTLCRRVLDELEHVAREHHRPRRRSQVLAELKGRLVD